MFCTDTLNPMPDPVEPERRRSGAGGTVVILSDGKPWLLANPVYRPRSEGLTEPRVDRPLDRIFESAVLNEGLSQTDVWEAARALLRANYDLTDEEASQLLSVAPGPESRALASGTLDALFGARPDGKTYTTWVRASLMANRLNKEEIPAQDLLNVLTVLVATGRTIPLSRFADACRLIDERARLEILI